MKKCKKYSEEEDWTKKQAAEAASIPQKIKKPFRDWKIAEL